jgi:hypothetical protein
MFWLSAAVTIGFTLGRSAYIGRHNDLHYALGYCGHGVALATYLGEKLAEMLLAKETNTAFADLPFRAIPLYSGNPWFRPLVYFYFSMRDRFFKFKTSAIILRVVLALWERLPSAIKRLRL